MKILITTLIIGSCSPLSYGEQEKILGRHPEITSTKTVEKPDGKLTIEVKISSPAYIVDDVPVVILYRPTIQRISIVSQTADSEVRHLSLQIGGRGLRLVDGAIPLLDSAGSKVGTVSFDSKNDRIMVLEIPSELMKNGKLTLSRSTSAIEAQPTNREPNKSEMATPRKPSD